MKVAYSVITIMSVVQNVRLVCDNLNIEFVLIGTYGQKWVTKLYNYQFILHGSLTI